MYAITKWLSGEQGRRLAVVAAVALGVCLVIGLVLVGRSALRTPSDPAAPPVPAGQALDPPAPASALVFVSGAVVQPGLYRLPPSARIADAVAAAGGLTTDADPGRLPDLAATVHDGRQVNVPFRRTAGGSAAAPPAADRVDVNSATADELAAVPGMPLGLPPAIVDARAALGGFATLSELRSTLGIDGATFAAIRPYLRAGGSTR